MNLSKTSTTVLKTRRELLHTEAYGLRIAWSEAQAVRQELLTRLDHLNREEEYRGTRLPALHRQIELIDRELAARQRSTARLARPAKSKMKGIEI